MSKCRGCGDLIRWAVSPNRRPIPLDPEPSEKGNVAFIGLTHQVEVLGPEAAAAARAAGTQLFMPHHATCPHREQFKKGKNERR